MHVELVAHDLGHALDRRALAPGADDDRLAQGLAHLDVALAACREAEPDRLAGRRHRELELGFALARLGEVAQVDARELAVEVVVELVGDERGEGSEQLRERHERRAQGGEGGRVGLPEAPSRTAHVPVREILDERRDRAPGGRRVVGGEPLASTVSTVAASREGSQRSRSVALASSRSLAGVGVEHEERVHVPELAQEPPEPSPTALTEKR